MATRTSLLGEPLPYEVDKVLEELRYYSGKEVVDNPDWGLKWQIENGVLEHDQLRDLLFKQRRLKQLFDAGAWRP